MLFSGYAPTSGRLSEPECSELLAIIASAWFAPSQMLDWGQTMRTVLGEDYSKWARSSAPSRGDR